MSFVGNLWIIAVTFYATIKQRRPHNHFTWLVANLAFADLVFTFLTIFNTISFHWRWPGGDSTCKFQGFLVEATYTTSISTLVVISYQRLKAVIHPFKAKFSCWARMKYMKLAIIWGLCFSVCSPLFFIYRVETQINGDIVCVTTTWGNTGRQIYYTLHGTLFFVLPLLYMIVTQTNIHSALQPRGVPIRNSLAEEIKLRHRKVARTLAALTIAFAICWSPFMITRTLLFFHLNSIDVAWRASQLLICVNPALDPLLYGYYGGTIKTVLGRILRGRFSRRRVYDVTSMTVFQSNTSTWDRSMINAVNRRKRGLFEGLITFSNLVKKETWSQ